ncbi:13578_t:CDS:10 [Entrophospora sp. SA101]|nr:13578_t:CDS:10 [Entrophospora sp. SA101]
MSIKWHNDLFLLRYFLKFYGLDVLEPTAWVEENDNRRSVRYSFVEGSTSPIVNGSGGGNVTDDRWSFEDIDPLSIKKSVLGQSSPDESFKEKSQLLVGTKSFNPKYFLHQVHYDTSYNDLCEGAKILRYTLDQKSEALRSLVQDNFDRFVSAKNTIDTVYNEMKANSLNPEKDYEASNKAEQVFGPVLANRNKAEKIRSTLSVLEKYKYFFTLPSSLMELIRQQKYDVVMRDYKKGKVILESTMSCEVPDNNNAGKLITEKESNDDAALSNQYRKVFDKVWTEVEKIMEEMKVQLFKQLTEPWRSMEDQEKTINILLELDTADDPVWHYLDSQFKFIIDLLEESYQEQLDKIEALKDLLPEMSGDSKGTALRLRNALRTINVRDYDSLTASKNMDVQIWKSTFELVKSLSDLLLRCLPDFWKLSKSFMDGKFQKSPAVLSANRRRRQGMDLRKVEQCQNMAKGVIDLYALLLFRFFSIDPTQTFSEDIATTAIPTTSPLFVPSYSDSITTCYFLTRILHVISDCVNDINSINMASDVSGALITLMKQIRGKFTEIICNVWNSDSKLFHLLEDWSLDSENREITNYLRNFQIFHKFNSSSAYKIVCPEHVSDKDDASGKSYNIDRNYTDKIKSTFVSSLFEYLDGLVHLAFTEYNPIDPLEKESTDIIHKSRIDPSQIESRILLTISNLSNLKQVVIPHLISQFESEYKADMKQDALSVNDLIVELDGVLFEDYIKSKKEVISKIVKEGILMGNIDWYNMSKPTEVNPYVYKALLSLVMVHSQVSDIAKQLVDRTLSALLESMSQYCLESFRQVNKFGMGGLLQATLEVEFMHQSLSQYITPKAQEIFKEIYETIERLYDSDHVSGSLDTELAGVKQLLIEGRKNTSSSTSKNIDSPIEDRNTGDDDNAIGIFKKDTFTAPSINNNKDSSIYDKNDDDLARTSNEDDNIVVMNT